MTQDQLSSWSPHSSDAELIAAVRNGATAAFGVLYERHAGAARTVARQYMSASGGADDVVADAFAKVLAVLVGGGGPTTAFRAYLFTVVRRLAYVAVNQSRRILPTDDAAFESVFGPSASSEEPALEKFERSTVAKAFKALPERWQAALWYSEVEGLTPAQFAPSLGLTANGAAALAYRAREGLRQQYLQQHLSTSLDAGCAQTGPLLAGYVRGGLSKRDLALVESHLEPCGECRGLLVELGDVSHGMRAIIAPLVLGTAGVGALGGLPLWGTAVAATGAGGAGGVLEATGSSSGAGGGSAAGTSSGAGAGTTAGSTAGSAAGAAGTGLAGTASGAGIAGIGAALAGVPALLVAAAAVVVVGVGVAVSAALGVFSDETEAPLAASVPSMSPDAGASSSPSPDAAASDPTDPANTLVPDSAPTGEAEAPADGTTPAPGARAATPSPSASPGTTAPPAASDPTPGAAGPRPAATPGPGGQPATDPATDPTAEPPAGPTPAPSTDPTTEPTTEPTPPPAAPAALELSFGAGTEIVARQNNTVAVSLRNTGGTVATDVAVSLTVPGTLRFIADSASGGVFGPRLLRTSAEGWSCAASGADTDTQVVHCVVDEIAPAADVTLTLTFYAEDAVTADLAAQVFVGEDAVGDPWPFTSSVVSAPPRLSASVAPVAELVAGRPGHLALTVANGGQLPAADPEVVLALPQDSGIGWRDAPIVPAPGSTPGWSCSVADDALVCGGPQIDGDRLATVIVPVAVAPGPSFTRAVSPTTTFAGSPEPAPAIRPSELSVLREGLSAASILAGPLQVAHIAGALGTAPRLTVPTVPTAPDGLTVREAVLTWSGLDADGRDAQALSTVELRTDAGGFAREQVVGTAAVQPPGAEGASSYSGTADVTALVAGHAAPGRWSLAPVEGAVLPDDLVWSLTVVYAHAGLPDATVALLLADPAAAGAAARPLPLPASGPVRVAMTGTVRGGVALDDPLRRDLTVNGTALAPVTGGLTDVVTYRSDDLLPVSQGVHSPLMLSLDPGSSVHSVLAVHSSAAAERPEPALTGVLDQPQPVVTAPAVSVEVADAVEIGDGVEVPVTVRNDSGVDLADVSVTITLPAGITTPTGQACAAAPVAPTDAAARAAQSPDGGAAVPATVTCLVGPLAAGETVVVTVALAGVDGLVVSGEVGYSVVGTDPVTGAGAEASGAFAVTAHPGLDVRGTWRGTVAVTEVGAPLMRCSPLSCWLASGGWWSDATNDLLAMRPLNDAGGVTSSSSATVTIPVGATVKHAGLYWSANRTATDRFTQDLTSARLRAPGTGTYTAVTGEVLGEVSDSTGRVSYQSYADVTEMVAAHGAGEWSVADVALAGHSDGSGWNGIIGSRDLYAGWSLVVVYEDAALPTGSVTVLDTPVAVTRSSGMTFSVLDEAATTTTLGVVAWEGDRQVTGDQVLVNSIPVRPLAGEGASGRAVLGSAQDAFSSVAWGSRTRYENTLGVDAKKFEPAATAPGATTVSAITTGDEYVVGVVTVTSR